MSETAANISARVRPGASKNEVVGFVDGVLEVRIAAPPTRGKANSELLAFLSQILGISKSRLSITRGHTGRNKVIAIQGLSLQEITGRLSSFSSSTTSKERRQ